MKMQHQRAGCLDNRAVKIVEIAKQIAIQETKQRDISDCQETKQRDISDTASVLSPADNGGG
ncbi:hypothetical protein LTSEGIV_2971 [Salmonella enterica subsp. enterica serovar Give str. S5-487]|nr:hypothetical protein LTSEGIV_2971 [Salmonella enterica subsp. enterica serovar Give str. S5-487]